MINRKKSNRIIRYIYNNKLYNKSKRLYDNIMNFRLYKYN